MENSGKTTYSIFGSSILHAGLVIAVLTAHFALPRDSKKETIQIEITGDGDASAAIPVPAPAPSDEKETLPAKVAKSAPQALPMKSVVSHVSTPTQAAPLAAVVAVTPDSSASETVMEEPATAETAVELDESVIAEDLDRADQEAAATLQAKMATKEEADDMTDDSDVLAEQAKKTEQENAAALAKASAARRAQEKADLEKSRQEREKSMLAEKARLKAEAEKKAQIAAMTRAQEAANADQRFQAARAAAIADASKASQERADAEAAALAEGESSSQAAEQDAEAGAAAALAAEQARGEAMKKSASNAGSFNQVRSLEDLKQMPGNTRPLYADEDRLAGHKGAVIFHAFITKEGSPNQFKLIQSSGYKNLDLKTLKAIRDWKFYPGQEGWVEIPFEWDLKGEPTLIRGTLRKVSRTN